MSARPFSPVWLTLPGSSCRRVDSAFEAFECLTTAWPVATGKPYEQAVQACRDALDGFISAAAARKAFVAAARAIGAEVQLCQPEIAMTNRRRNFELAGAHHIA